MYVKSRMHNVMRRKVAVQYRKFDSDILRSAGSNKMSKSTFSQLKLQKTFCRLCCLGTLLLTYSTSWSLFGVCFREIAMYYQFRNRRGGFQPGNSVPPLWVRQREPIHYYPKRKRSYRPSVASLHVLKHTGGKGNPKNQLQFKSRCARITFSYGVARNVTCGCYDA